jgi:LacI family transcriptional regulator
VAASLTLEEIAELAGVSRSTVSRVVNDHPSVRDGVRERVLQVIQETGYQPHAAARSLVTRRTHIIGVVIAEAVTKLFRDPFFPLLLYGVTATCNTHQYHLMLSLFDDPADQGETYRRLIGSGHLDGVLVASAHLNDPLFPKLLQDAIPFVVVGRHPDERINSVDVDNVSAARMAVEHLIRLGHTRIATITGPLTMSHGEDRLAGYRQALEAHQLAVDERLIVEGDYTEAGGSLGAQRLLPASPTAIFVASDVMAIGALKALRDAGLRVPQDVALVGFDDVPIAAAIEPALTTVRQPIERLGSMAADLLLNLLANPSVGRASTQRIVLPTQLIVRDSCGAWL